MTMTDEEYHSMVALEQEADVEREMADDYPQHRDGIREELRIFLRAFHVPEKQGAAIDPFDITDLQLAEMLTDNWKR
jgi:hypothetical protein